MLLYSGCTQSVHMHKFMVFFYIIPIRYISVDNSDPLGRGENVNKVILRSQVIESATYGLGFLPYEFHWPAFIVWAFKLVHAGNKKKFHTSKFQKAKKRQVFNYVQSALFFHKVQGCNRHLHLHHYLWEKKAANLQFRCSCFSGWKFTFNFFS